MTDNGPTGPAQPPQGPAPNPTPPTGSPVVGDPRNEPRSPMVRLEELEKRVDALEKAQGPSSPPPPPTSLLPGTGKGRARPDC